MGYAELKCKTAYSFLEGASQPDELMARADELGLSALAITDRNGVYAIPKAYWCSKGLSKTRLIVGADLTLEGGSSVVLLAKNRSAYGLLCRMLTQAHHGKEKGTASLLLSEFYLWMEDLAAQGLIALPSIKADFARLKPYFGGRIFFPLGLWMDGFDAKRIELAQQAEKNWGIPTVATNDVLYHQKSRKKIQDAMTAIKAGVPLKEAGYRLSPNGERYLKSDFEMRLLFKELPEAVSRTVEIAESCRFCPSELRYRYPSEWIPAGETSASYLEREVWRGSRSRYPQGVPEGIKTQIQYELDLIRKLEFEDYFLTIYEIVLFARSRDILCQGRGGAANSVVCYCLGITAVDPTRINLLFERFISMERKEPPDIDIDFEHERREEVLQFIYQRYGRDRAAMVSAVITYQKRSAFRELSKAFGVEVGAQSAKNLEQNFDALAEKAGISHLKDQLQEMAEEMEGFPRHLSIHSGGFTLSADPITEIVPIEPARMEGRTIIQWDKNDLDYLGLLKVDLLALGMLSALKKTLTQIGMNLADIPPEDVETYRMIQNADTVGTFQVESRAQMNMSGRLLPKSFYDLVVQIAMVRPGPIVGGMVHPYLRRRRGDEKVTYPHPKLQQILGRTLGVPLFQEQIMRIAIDLAEFTPGEADQLRRAIGAWRSTGSIYLVGKKLMEGLRKNGIPEEYANMVFEQLKGFSHYGFPESHAASFALLTYASCYLKKYHPAEFTCGLLNSQPLGFYDAHTLVDDAKRHGVEVLDLDPERSEWMSQAQKGQLFLGFHAVKGMSRKEAESIIESRPFRGLADFLGRTQLKPALLHRMAMAGAFSKWTASPREALWQVLQYSVERNHSQLDLFSGIESGARKMAFSPLSESDTVHYQYQAYGLSAAGHPMAALRKDIKLRGKTTTEARKAPTGTVLHTAGLLLVRQKPPTANGVVFSVLEDEYGFLDLVLFPKVYSRLKSVFLSHCFLKVSGKIERDQKTVSLIVLGLQPVWLESEKNEKKSFEIEPTQYFF